MAKVISCKFEDENQIMSPRYGQNVDIYVQISLMTNLSMQIYRGTISLINNLNPRSRRDRQHLVMSVMMSNPDVSNILELNGEKYPMMILLSHLESRL